MFLLAILADLRNRDKQRVAGGETQPPHWLPLKSVTTATAVAEIMETLKTQVFQPLKAQDRL